MRNFIIPELLIAAALLMFVGCNKPPQHQVEMSPPPMPEDQTAKQQPRLKEIRPLDAGAPDADQPDNGETPPTISEVTKASEADNSARIYHVQQGDTFWKISQTQLGNGQRWREIVKLNPDANPNKLSVGQPIRIPNK